MNTRDRIIQIINRSRIVSTWVNGNLDGSQSEEDHKVSGYRNRFPENTYSIHCWYPDRAGKQPYEVYDQIDTLIAKMEAIAPLDEWEEE